MDAWMHALEAMRAFMKSEPVGEDPHGILHELAIGWYDSVTESAAEAAHKLRVAEFLAERGPEGAVMREHGAHLYVRSDAINDAFSTLIDERELTEQERLVTIAAVWDAARQVNGDYEKFRREQGLRD
jgi:hypothetical protein